MSLDVIDLTKRYGEKTVVDHLSFSMPKPGVYALLGTNGAGKTTTIRMMLGILSRDGGQVLWEGKELNPTSCNLGYLAEERGLYPKYPLMDQLMYFAGLRGCPKTLPNSGSATWLTGFRWRSTFTPMPETRLSVHWGERAFLHPGRKSRNRNWRISFPKAISRRFS